MRCISIHRSEDVFVEISVALFVFLSSLEEPTSSSANIRAYPNVTRHERAPLHKRQVHMYIPKENGTIMSLNSPDNHVLHPGKPFRINALLLEACSRWMQNE